MVKVRKILLSVLVIAMTIGLVAAGASGAWFSDMETTAGSPDGNNQYWAGSIDLDPIDGYFIVEDLKPCIEKEGYITLHNNGLNDGNAWLHITNVLGTENGTTDAECEAYLANSGFDPNALRYDNDLERVTVIDLWIDYDQDGFDEDYDSKIIAYEDGWTMADLECQWIPLGELKVCDFVDVYMSFHILPEAGNEFQTDMVTFDIEVLLQQKNADAPDNEWPSDMRLLRLENKQEEQGGPSCPDCSKLWEPITTDDRYGILTYDCQKKTFDYTFEGYGLEDIEYSLIYYADPWPGNNPGALIGSGTASGGRLSLSGSPDLGMDLPDPADANYPDGAKIWLVPSDYYNEVSGEVTWAPDSFLYETRLINYHDTNIP